uniref:Pentraxin family member n=1 Tax=Geotrypetes seraphini TaxID=260995 RepID=A0A6P8PY21_GEOSA|nr:serum amyloid P-component-like [Geotrypetes seraphini]
MGRLTLHYLFFILGTVASTDLGNNVILFPNESITSYVILKPLEISSLISFTVCLNYYTALTRDFALFSFANPEKANDILIYMQGSSTYSVSVGDEDVYFIAPERTPGWKHICISWESSTGVVTLWINGNALPRKTLKKGYSIKAQPFIALGQDQDSYGGSFDKKQSYEGEISDVQMWNFILSPNQIQLAMVNSNSINGNILNWKSMEYELKGDAIIQSKLVDYAAR